MRAVGFPRQEPISGKYKILLSTTLRIYLEEIKESSLPRLGKAKLLQLTDKDLGDLYDSMKEIGVLHKTIRNHHAIISSALYKASGRDRFGAISPPMSWCSPPRRRGDALPLGQRDIVFHPDVGGESVHSHRRAHSYH